MRRSRNKIRATITVTRQKVAHLCGSRLAALPPCPQRENQSPLSYTMTRVSAPTGHGPGWMGMEERALDAILLDRNYQTEIPTRLHRHRDLSFRIPGAPLDVTLEATIRYCCKPFDALLPSLPSAMATDIAGYGLAGTANAGMVGDCCRLPAQRKGHRPPPFVPRTGTTRWASMIIYLQGFWFIA